jgi:glycosyltransferase involved in cell wall biosynthesis
MHVVVFPGWYPNKTDRLSGDFIQRHIQAISQSCRVTVIIPVKDRSIEKAFSTKSVEGNLTELYFYYPSSSSIELLDNLLSFIRYNYLCIRWARGVIKRENVTLCHLYVLQKNYFIGPALQLLYKIPFVVSEQSTLYVDGGYEKFNGLKKKIWKYVFEKAASYHAVSRFLANNIKNKLGLNKEGVIIPNVVDSSLFYYDHKLTNPQTTFVHVSNMVQQKNVEGMLKAFAEVKKTSPHFILHLVGPLPERIRALIERLDLSWHVTTWGEKSYQEVAEMMRQGDVFVFFTRYETFGCVIIEANACGLPVIISDLEVTRELVTDNFNGLFVESEDITGLAAKILSTMHNPQKFDPLAISLQTRNKYNYQQVSKQFVAWYNSVC